MPVTVSKDKDGCYAQWGSQAKYHYRCGDSKAEKEAVRKAEAQGQAIRASGWQEKK